MRTEYYINQFLGSWLDNNKAASADSKNSPVIHQQCTTAEYHNLETSADQSSLTSQDNNAATPISAATQSAGIDEDDDVLTTPLVSFELRAFTFSCFRTTAAYVTAPVFPLEFWYGLSCPSIFAADTAFQ